jgi:hypothetical protein
MSVVVTAPIAPRMVRHSVGTRRMTAVAGAVTAGVTALTLALLGPSMVVPPTPTVASRRYRRGDRAGTAAKPGPASEIRLHQWCGTAMGEPVWIIVVGDDPGLLDVGRARLNELAEKWTPQGQRSEIARLNAYPGVMLPMSADTMLLADVLTSGPGPERLLVDARHGAVGRTCDQELDLGQTALTLTSDLVIRDMLEAGAESASVRLGSWTHTHTT